MQAVSDVLWPQILDAVGGDEAARLLLLGLGSATTWLRALVKRLRSFRLELFAAEISACRASFRKIASLRVVTFAVDVVRLSLLNGIPSLHLDGPGNLRASFAQPSLSVTVLTLSGSTGDLEFLDAMPLLEELRIDGLERGSCLSPLNRPRIRQLRGPTENDLL